MTPKKWLTLVGFVLAFLWGLVYYPIQAAHALFALAGLMIILGGIYGFWTGQLVDEFGIEIKGRWAYILSVVAIVIGLWILLGGYRLPVGRQ